jgi:glyoxylase-like metal-dependent hydrolase (beta-lactamase superfamily II)/rhodanese-related sulfurtransferase
MILEQYYLGCLSQASYLIGDERTGVAIVVDPRRDVDDYVADAARLGLRIEHVILTHFHADFVAGHLELRQRTGARIHLGPGAHADYEFHALADGEVLEFGDVRLRILHTPGHTPESISILVYDLAAEPTRPRAVLTGDTLFVGDVGRPDLLASVGVTADTLARMLYQSLHEKLLPLPDDTLLFPGHGAGSACGKHLGAETVSSIGEQRRSNYALQPMDEAEFVGLVTADQPEAPAYFGRDAELNRRQRALLEETLRLDFRPLSLTAALAAQGDGAELLDTRDPAEFARGHLAGSLHVGLGGRFATWAGTLIPLDRQIVVVASPGREREAAIRLGRVGFERVLGYLDGGIEAARGEVPLIERPRRIPSGEVSSLTVAGLPLIDVRSSLEHAQEAIPGSLNIPLPQLTERLGEIPAGQVLVYCRSGERSSTAASLLERAGHIDVLDLIGGFTAWKSAPRQEPAQRTFS